MSDTNHTETHSPPPDPLGLLVVALDGAAVGRVTETELVVHETFERRIRRPLPNDADDNREQRERERASFFQRVADAAAASLLDADPVPAVVVGGTVTDVDRLRETLDPELDDRVTTTETVEYGGERGLRALRDAVVPDTDDTLDVFFERLGDGGVAYGEKAVRTAAERGDVETLLVASTLPERDRDALKTVLGETSEDADCVDATVSGPSHVVVDAETERGTKFVTAFGGVGALLDE